MSVRLDYSVDSLRKQITDRRDRNIAAAEAAYAEALDLPARRDAWRAEQEKRVRSLARRIKAVPDNELGSFEVPSCPTLSRWDKPADERDRAIEKAEQQYTWAIGRLDGLRTKDGVLSLTPTMLRDWFGL